MSAWALSVAVAGGVGLAVGLASRALGIDPVAVAAVAAVLGVGAARTAVRRHRPNP